MPREPKLKKIIPNYKKNVLEIEVQKGAKNTTYQLPFSLFEGENISSKNRFKKIEIEKDLDCFSAVYELENGSKGDFPVDFVLYHCEPKYDWSPLNQIKMVLKNKMEASQLSVRVMAEALNTSPSQVMRLLEKNRASKQLFQLMQLAQLAGYKLEISLKPIRPNKSVTKPA